MKSWLRFAFDKVNPFDLKFHYLRVGKASKLFDTLVDNTKEFRIIWDMDEVAYLGEFRFDQSYNKYDATVINLHIDDDNLDVIRKDFWENYVWKTEDHPKITALIVPNSSSLGSLTIPQLYESLSFQRVTERAIKLFENQEGVEKEVISWLVQTSSLFHIPEDVPNNAIES